MLIPATRLVLIATLGLFTFLFSATTQPVQAVDTPVTGQTYYVDCAGSDSNAGTSTSTAWATLTKANTASLQPGDGIRFKRGCVFTGRLNASWSGTYANPIVVGAYGTGADPVITNALTSFQSGNYTAVTITGNYKIIEHLTTELDKSSGAFPSSQLDSVCRTPVTDEPTAVGWFYGFNIKESSHHNTLQYVSAEGFTAGAHVEAYGPDANGHSATPLVDIPHHNNIFHSQFLRNDSMGVLTPDDENNPSTLYDDIGAFGINLKGNYNEIAYNYIKDNNGCAYRNETELETDGMQGNSIELFIAQGNHIHHNIAINEHTFSEIGGDSDEETDYNSKNNTYVYNLYYSENEIANFIVHHGHESRYGGVENTTLVNNTVYVPGSEGQGVICVTLCTGTDITMRNNVIWAGRKAIYAKVGSSIVEKNNIFWNGTGTFGNEFIQNITLNSNDNSLLVDPELLDPGTNFRPASGSAVIDSGITTTQTHDLDGTTLSGVRDRGAYEFTPNQIPTVNMTSPTENEQFLTTDTIDLAATAADQDPDGHIVKVEFYANNVYVGEDNTVPYEFSWVTPAADDYYVRAKAIDNEGGFQNSGRNISVTVPVNEPPTVTLPNLTSGTIFAMPTNIYMEAIASDTDGTITKVEFIDNHQLVYTDYTYPYEHNWVNLTEGTHTLRVKAFDNSGAIAHAGITIGAGGPQNLLPTISIPNITPNTVYQQPTNIQMTALAYDYDGTVAKVEFYDNNQLVHTDYSSPYEHTYSGLSIGSHTLRAKAIDNDDGFLNASVVIEVE